MNCAVFSEIKCVIFASYLPPMSAVSLNLSSAYWGGISILKKKKIFSVFIEVIQRLFKEAISETATQKILYS